MRPRQFALLIIVKLLLVAFASSASAQRNTATFTGMVVDTSGGVLPGADVALTK